MFNCGVFFFGDLYGIVLIYGYKEEDKRLIKYGGFFFLIFENLGERSWWGLMNIISVNYIICNLYFGE